MFYCCYRFSYILHCLCCENISNGVVRRGGYEDGLISSVLWKIGKYPVPLLDELQRVVELEVQPGRNL